ncbi:MAG: FecCD family ABC transporter permease [Pyrinomonadaceae bacterium]
MRTTAKNRAAKVLLVLAGLLVLVFLISLNLGSEALPVLNLNQTQASIFYEIRLPRVLLGAFVGASLAVAGAALQSLLRNPLAEPYLLGVSNGAALGTMVAFIFFITSDFAKPLGAIIGAAGATFAVYRLAHTRAGMNVERLILSGVIVTTFLSSIIILFTSLLDATKLRSFTFWLLGDLSQANITGIYVCGVAAAIGIIVLMSKARALNLMMLGERDAFDLGVEVKNTRLIVFTTSSALVGVSVAASGSVGFVGLIVPHIVRLAVGSDNRIVIPCSALFGAAFVMLADTFARTAIAPRELPVGAITALIGCPLFIYLLRRSS